MAMREHTRQRTLPRAATRQQPRDEKGLRGTIKAIKRAEGYGFVTHSGTGEDYFFHRSNVTSDSEVPFEDLKLDQEVVFEPSDGPKGLRASTVRAV